MADWIPLLQTGLWVALVIVLVIWLWRPLNALVEVFIIRARSGAPFKAGPVEVGVPPSILKTTAIAALTAEGTSGGTVEDSVRKLMENKEYPSGLQEEVYLVHEAQVLRERTSPRSGRYRIRVWVEAYDNELLNRIKRVTYRLYDDFHPDTVVATEAREREFELWMNVYGEFTLFAYAECENAPNLWLTRYLDLPGRPPD